MTKIIVGLVIIALAALYFQSREKLAEKTAQGKEAPGATSPPRPNTMSPAITERAPGAAALPTLPVFSTPTKLPLARTITDAQGRALEGTVLGKASNAIAFRRTADGKEFVIPISRLSPSDQAFLQSLADQLPEELQRITTELKVAGRVANWNSDLDLAAAEVKKYGLPMFLVFTGPDWCQPCERMERNIFSQSEFKRFANSRLVLMKVLVPAKGRLNPKHQKLIATYGVSSYPHIVITSPDGKIMYQKSGGYDDLPAYLAMIGKELSVR